MDKLTNIASQKREILERVESLTEAFSVVKKNADGSVYIDANALKVGFSSKSNNANPSNNNQSPTTEIKPANLRENLSNIITLAGESQQINKESTESLTTLLDWFFDLRALDEGDDITQDPTQLFADDTR